MIDGKIPAGSKWRHKSGRLYTVIMTANEQSERDDYPRTVVYHDENGGIWSKTQARFLETMQFVGIGGA